MTCQNIPSPPIGVPQLFAQQRPTSVIRTAVHLGKKKLSPKTIVARNYYNFGRFLVLVTLNLPRIKNRAAKTFLEWLVIIIKTFNTSKVIQNANSDV